jgi:hypothetical protein
MSAKGNRRVGRGGGVARVQEAFIVGGALELAPGVGSHGLAGSMQILYVNGCGAKTDYSSPALLVM